MIELRDLRKSFGPNRVLAGIDLDVATGESLVVIGGSGSGKSVLLKCILGLIQPDAGSIDRHQRRRANGGTKRHALIFGQRNLG